MRSIRSHYNSPKQNFDLLIVRGCFGEVWGRFGKYFGEMFGELFRTCLRGFWPDPDKFLHSFSEGC